MGVVLKPEYPVVLKAGTTLRQLFVRAKACEDKQNCANNNFKVKSRFQNTKIRLWAQGWLGSFIMYKYSYATINKAQNLNPQARKPRTQLGVSLKAEQQKLEQYQGSSLWEPKETAAKT